MTTFWKKFTRYQILMNVLRKSGYFMKYFCIYQSVKNVFLSHEMYNISWKDRFDKVTST